VEVDCALTDADSVADPVADPAVVAVAVAEALPLLLAAVTMLPPTGPEVGLTTFAFAALLLNASRVSPELGLEQAFG
jgi:hypothetical protein